MHADTETSKVGVYTRSEKAVDADIARLIAAIDAWYGRHFHRAAIEGRPPISATDKADLVKAATATVTKE